MKNWLLLSLLSLFSWGFWGFFGKLGSKNLSSENLIIHSTIGTIISLPIFFLLFYQDITFSNFSSRNIYAILGGFIGSIGGIFFYTALFYGETSKVVTITSLYPIITIILSILFLKENITLSKIIGLSFSLLGIIILSK